MSDLFASIEELPIDEKKRGIPGATILKGHATSLATTIMGKIPQGDAEFLEQVKASQSSVQALDDLVKQQCGTALVIEEIAQFNEEEAQKLLKSNQSNRSRRKNLPMTQQNYMEYLIAACAEWIVRESCGITKNANPFGAGRKALEINDETLAQLADDPDALGRAIRNLQSKKSTFKAKHQDQPDWEKDPEYVELINQLETLKSMRSTIPAGRKGVSIKKALQFIFDGVDETANLHQQECVDIINACRDLAKGIYPAEFLDMVEAQNAAKQAEAEADMDSVYAE